MTVDDVQPFAFSERRKPEGLIDNQVATWALRSRLLRSTFCTFLQKFCWLSASRKSKKRKAPSSWPLSKESSALGRYHAPQVTPLHPRPPWGICCAPTRLREVTGIERRPLLFGFPPRWTRLLHSGLLITIAHFLSTPVSGIPVATRRLLRIRMAPKGRGRRHGRTATDAAAALMLASPALATQVQRRQGPLSGPLTAILH